MGAMGSALLNRRQASLLAAALVLAANPQAHAADGARWLPWPDALPTPALRLPDLEGKAWDLAQEQGAPVLVNFWATWCEPCRAEMKSFEALEHRFKAQRLKMVAVNFKEARESVQRFRDANALSLAFVRDSYGEAARAWGVTVFPTTFVINASGRAVLRIEGEVDWVHSGVQKRLQAFL
jgi:thiol-disulfide isomerase/thioredoxin